MHYNPQKHHRRSIRLKDYDYTQPGAYFVTIVAWRRQMTFGQIHEGEVQLNPAGEIVLQVWKDLPRHFKTITLGTAVVMPNHFHGIICLNGRGEASASNCAAIAHASPLQSPKGTPPGSLSAIIQNFKSISSRKIAQNMGKTGSPLWQRNYYERVIRNDDELHQLSEYILNNPSAWATDEENPHRHP